MACLALVTACSDDGLLVQDLNSSSTAGGGSSGVGESASVTTGQAEGTAGQDAGQDGSNSTGQADDTGPASTTSEPPESSETGTRDTEGTRETEGGTTEGTTEGGTTEGSTTGEPCDPINPDGSGIGVTCRSDLDCLDGYTCQPFAGVAFQPSCQILCAQDCECPAGLTCNETVDKTGIPWFQCG